MWRWAVLACSFLEQLRQLVLALSSVLLCFQAPPSLLVLIKADSSFARATWKVPCPPPRLSKDWVACDVGRKQLYIKWMCGFHPVAAEDPALAAEIIHRSWVDVLHRLGWLEVGHRWWERSWPYPLPSHFLSFFVSRASPRCSSQPAPGPVRIKPPPSFCHFSAPIWFPLVCHMSLFRELVQSPAFTDEFSASQPVRQSQIHSEMIAVSNNYGWNLHVRTQYFSDSRSLG